MKGYRKYFGKKILWFVITFIAALLLNFILPRLMPGDPVSMIVSKQAQGLTEASAVKAIYDNYAREFGTNRPMTEQFVTYIGNLFRGDMGTSFSQYASAPAAASSAAWRAGWENRLVGASMVNI